MGTRVNMTFDLQMYLFKDEDSYVVYCPSLDMSAYGNTEEQAKKSFEDILAITVQYWINKNTLVKDLQKHGWKIKSKNQKKIKEPSFSELYTMNQTFRELVDSKKEYFKYDKEVELPALAS